MTPVLLFITRKILEISYQNMLVSQLLGVKYQIFNYNNTLERLVKRYSIRLRCSTPPG